MYDICSAKNRSRGTHSTNATITRKVSCPRDISSKSLKIYRVYCNRNVISDKFRISIVIVSAYLYIIARYRTPDFQEVRTISAVHSALTNFEFKIIFSSIYNRPVNSNFPNHMSYYNSSTPNVSTTCAPTDLVSQVHPIWNHCSIGNFYCKSYLINKIISVKR